MIINPILLLLISKSVKMWLGLKLHSTVGSHKGFWQFNILDNIWQFCTEQFRDSLVFPQLILGPYPALEQYWCRLFSLGFNICKTQAAYPLTVTHPHTTKWCSLKIKDEFNFPMSSISLMGLKTSQWFIFFGKRKTFIYKKNSRVLDLFCLYLPFSPNHLHIQSLRRICFRIKLKI